MQGLPCLVFAHVRVKATVSHEQPYEYRKPRSGWIIPEACRTRHPQARWCSDIAHMEVVRLLRSSTLRTVPAGRNFGKVANDQRATVGTESFRSVVIFPWYRS